MCVCVCVCVPYLKQVFLQIDVLGAHLQTQWRQSTCYEELYAILKSTTCVATKGEAVHWLALKSYTQSLANAIV